MTNKYIIPVREIRFEDCVSCLNREYDKFKCLGCKDASNYEDENDEDNLMYHEFLEECREQE